MDAIFVVEEDYIWMGDYPWMNEDFPDCWQWNGLSRIGISQEQETSIPNKNVGNVSETSEMFTYENCLHIVEFAQFVEHDCSSGSMVPSKLNEEGQLNGANSRSTENEAHGTGENGSKRMKKWVKAGKTQNYLCEFCGKTCGQLGHLNEHIRFHTGIKPFTCAEKGCNASFTIRIDLKDHIRKKHTNERPFVCEYSGCNKAFKTGNVYYQHRLIHSNDRRYPCKLCPKKFLRSTLLRAHEYTHTGEKPFACSACPKKYRQKYDRDKHFRSKHQIP